MLLASLLLLLAGAHAPGPTPVAGHLAAHADARRDAQAGSVVASDVATPVATPVADDEGGCRRCDHRGVEPCGEHDEELLAMEAEVLFCSVVAACEECLGTLLVDCDRCDGGPDSARIPERRAEIEAWLFEDRMSAFLERPVPHVETEHFELVCDVPVMKDGKKKKDPHLTMHLVARDVERVATLIGEHFDITREDYFSKMRMWIWKDPRDHAAVMREFLLSTSTGDFKLLGKDPVFSVWTEPPFDTVPGVRRLFTHNSSHMLLSNLYRMLWTGDTGGGWFDAGAGHWYEYEVHDLSVSYCIEEATVPLEYHGGVWRTAIKKRLRKEEERQLPRILPLNTGAMTLPDQALCWSLYDWLVHEHPESLAPLQRALKEKRTGREVLEEVLGMKVLAVEEAWRAWVEEAYPLRGDELKLPERDEDEGRKRGDRR